jgi:hypothetical protein
MGRPSQRAARLHFRTTSIFSEDAHGPGSGECWRARAKRRGKRAAASRRRKSCGLARAARRRIRTERCSVRQSKSASGKVRFAGASEFSCGVAGKCWFVPSRRTFSGPNWIAGASKFCCSITSSGCRLVAGAKRITNYETDGIASAGGFSSDVAVSSASK